MEGTPSEAAIPGDRRQLKTRNSGWALKAALWLAHRRVSPNIISIFSIVFGAAACFAFIATRWSSHHLFTDACFVLAIIGIQLRLLCNLLDGMVAVEGKFGTGKLGEVFNDLPDRITDALIFTGAGVCAGGKWGLIAGLAVTIGAILTAYVRVLGKAIGARSHFAGPMAKQHRMAVLTVACVLCAVGVWFGYVRPIMLGALAVIFVGCVLTVVNRLRLIRVDVEAK